MGCNCKQNRSSFLMNRYMNLYPSFETNSNTSTRTFKHPLKKKSQEKSQEKTLSNTLKTFSDVNKKVIYKTPDDRVLKSVHINPSMLRGFYTIKRH